MSGYACSSEAPSDYMMILTRLLLPLQDPSTQSVDRLS